jgi:hypothetical protein
MDIRFPPDPPPRRGRSAVAYSFARDAPFMPIRSERAYCLLDLLEHANEIAIHREKNDPLYRGEVRIIWLCSRTSY